MTSKSIDDYFSALDRLKNGTSRIAPKGTRITNDAVAIEAGRRKGSIKKSRPAFANLIASIDEASASQKSPEKAQSERLAKAKSSSEKYRAELDAALGRELCLLREIVKLKKQLMELTGQKITPIRKI